MIAEVITRIDHAADAMPTHLTPGEQTYRDWVCVQDHLRLAKIRLTTMQKRAEK